MIEQTGWLRWRFWFRFNNNFGRFPFDFGRRRRRARSHRRCGRRCCRGRRGRRRRSLLLFNCIDQHIGHIFTQFRLIAIDTACCSHSWGRLLLLRRLLLRFGCLSFYNRLRNERTAIAIIRFGRSGAAAVIEF